MPLTYELLLSLCGGRGAVVEQLTAADRDALRLETPLANFIEETALAPSPKHVVLTGSAGDGKTFAALAAAECAPGLTVITDASAHPSSAGPLRGLIDRLRDDLHASRRLLLAINRGQLERLSQSDCGGDPALLSVVSEIREGSRLQAAWSTQPKNVAVVDLGLFDWTSSLRLMLDRAITVDLAGVSGAARVAAKQACEALSAAHVRSWIERVVSAVQADGRHLTMRQLWSFVGYLVTGARAPGDPDQTISLEDTVGARLFSYQATGTPLEGVLRAQDPALAPDPLTTKALLCGTLGERLKAMKGVGPLAQGSARLDDGPSAVRAASVHDPRRAPPDDGADMFTRLTKALMSRDPGWHPLPPQAKTLLRGMYKALGLWAADPNFPAWQRLCYDSARSSHAGAVSGGQLKLSALVFGVPRPSEACLRALDGHYRPPYVWLAARGSDGTSPTPVRLSPRLLNLLYRVDSKDDLAPGEALVLARWLGRLPVDGPEEDDLLVMRVAGGEAPLRVGRDLSGLTRIQE